MQSHNLPMCTKIMNISRLTAPCLMGMSQYFYIPLQTSIIAASNGSSLMSIGGRVHKVTYAHQNHKAWLTSQVYSSKSNRGFIFRKHRNRSLMWCKSGLDSTLCSCTTCMGTWISPISEAWSWTWLLQCSHIPTGTVKAVLTGMWTLDHLNTHVLKDRSFAWTQLGTDGAEICRLAQLFCCMTTA